MEHQLSQHANHLQTCVQKLARNYFYYFYLGDVALLLFTLASCCSDRCINYTCT